MKRLSIVLLSALVLWAVVALVAATTAESRSSCCSGGGPGYSCVTAHTPYLYQGEVNGDVTGKNCPARLTAYLYELTSQGYTQIASLYADPGAVQLVHLVKRCVNTSPHWFRVEGVSGPYDTTSGSIKLACGT